MNERQLTLIAEVVSLCEGASIPCWLRGGWAMDFFLGRITREHEDIDLFVWANDAPALGRELERAGYHEVGGSPPEAQRDFVKDGEALQIALLEMNERGEVVVAGGPWAGTPHPEGMLAGTIGRLGDVTCPIVHPIGRRCAARLFKTDAAGLATIAQQHLLCCKSEYRRNTMQRIGINCPELTPPVGPFSHLMDVGSALYLSGQVAQDPDTGKLIEGDVAAQTTRILANLQAVLKSVDRDLRNIVKVTVFLTDMADFGEMNAVYAQHFELPYPARTTVAVKALPLGARVEFECVAQ